MVVSVFIFFLSFCFCHGDEGYFWHVTDLHWDYSYYVEGLSCTQKNVTERGLYGDYLCDSPLILLDETLKGAKMIKRDVDFIIWTGDTAPHVDKHFLSTSIVINSLKYITELIQGSFPGVPVYPALGNHDYFPKDQFPPGNNEIYNATYNMWRSWIGDDSQKKYFLKGGYYTVKTKQGHRIIALNTNLYYSDNQTSGLDDPADQFAWLESQLILARLRNEKVIVIGHVPPGITTPAAVCQMNSTFNDRLVCILQHYSGIITAMHFGHEHHDSLRILYNASGYPAIPVFIAPSVTPISWKYEGNPEPNHNPGVRLIKYDRQSNIHLDFMQYFVDLPASNDKKYVYVAFGYNATEEYGIPDIMPEALAKLLDKFQDPAGEYFQRYIQWLNTNGTKDYKCDARCHRAILCGLRYFRTQEFSKCFSPTEEVSALKYRKYFKR